MCEIQMTEIKRLRSIVREYESLEGKKALIEEMIKNNELIIADLRGKVAVCYGSESIGNDEFLPVSINGNAIQISICKD